MRRCLRQPRLVSNSVAEVSLELLDPPDSTSQELGLQVYTATPSSFYFLESQFFPSIHAMILARMTRYHYDDCERIRTHFTRSTAHADARLLALWTNE